MDATLILIDGDAELLRARALVDQLWNSTQSAGVEFIDENGGGPGVRLRKPTKQRR